MLTKQDLNEISTIVKNSEDRLLKLITELHQENADRITKNGEKIDNLGIRMGRVENRLDKVEYRLDGIDNRLDKMDERFDSMDKRFDKLEVNQMKLKKSFESYKNDNNTKVTYNRFKVDEHEKVLNKIGAFNLAGTL